MSDIPCNNCGVRFSEYQTLEARKEKLININNYLDGRLAQLKANLSQSKAKVKELENTGLIGCSPAQFIEKIQTLEAKVKELEEKHRLQLSAIMTIAYANTKEVFNKCLIDEGNPYWTVAFNDVCEAVKREMALLDKIKDYESGHRGACFTCEPVGELNKKLEARLEVLTKCRGWQKFRGRDRKLYCGCYGCENKNLLNKEGVKSEEEKPR